MFTVRVEMMPGLKLGFSVWLDISAVDMGINKSTGDIIVEDEHEHLLYKFHLQQNGSYKEEWRHVCPENIKRHCRIYLTDTGNIIVQNKEEDSTTFLFDQDMKLIDSWQHQGHLIAILSGTRAAYAVREGQEWHVEITIQDGDVLQLKPDGSTWESKYLNVCDDARTEKLVVIHRISGALHIFSRDGKTMQSLHTDTEYQCLCVQLQTPRKLFIDAPLDAHRSIYKTQGNGDGVGGRRVGGCRGDHLLAGISHLPNAVRQQVLIKRNRIVRSYNFQMSYDITGWWIIEQTIRRCTRNCCVMVK